MKSKNPSFIKVRVFVGNVIINNIAMIFKMYYKNLSNVIYHYYLFVTAAFNKDCATAFASNKMMHLSMKVYQLSLKSITNYIFSNFVIT